MSARQFQAVLNHAIWVIAASWLPQLAALHPFFWSLFLLLGYFPARFHLLNLHRRVLSDQWEQYKVANYYGGQANPSLMAEIRISQRDIEALILRAVCCFTGLAMGVWALWR